MKMKTLSIWVFVLIGALTFACGGKDTEKQISEMESKLAELQGGAKSAASTAVPAAKQAATATPEQKPDGPLPAFKFAEEDYDFGTIKEGEIAEHTFKFTNTGDAPLIIESAQASCGCTVPSWPKEPIPPGKDGEVQVRFNSQGKPGIQNKTVTITANTYPKLTRLRIKTFVDKADKN